MDDVIRKTITIGLPTLLFFIVAGNTGKTGQAAIWRALENIGHPFGLLMSLAILVFVGLAASYLSRYIVDGLLVKFYQKRRQLEPPEKLLIEIDKLPLSHDLKIKLSWIVTYNYTNPINHFNLKYITTKILILVIIITALLSISGYFGASYRLLELTAHFKLQYLTISFTCAIFFLLTQTSKRWLVVSTFCIIINLAEIVPWYFPQPASAAEISGQKLRIFQSNVLTGNSRYADVISLVREEKPDIAVFVEVTRSTWAKKLTALKDILPYSFGNQDSEEFGMVIYSKIPLNNTALKNFSSGRKSLLTDIKIQGKIITLLVAHPPFPIKNRTFVDRNHQLAGIGKYVAEAQNPVIVVGDLNVTMWSPFYKSMVETGGLRNARSGFGILPTWPTYRPLISIPIDHCLVSEDIQVLNIRLGRQVGSDHLPLITDLAINNY